MYRFKRTIAITAALLLLGSLLGCSINQVGQYRVAGKLLNQSFCIGFRQGDKVRVPVLAAIAELQASGKVKSFSVQWFGDDITDFKGDDKALDILLQSLEPRTLIVGCDGGRLPFSGEDENGVMTGFDVELAKEVCTLLNWKVKFIPIDVSEAEVELNSGNVDCVWGGFAYDESFKTIDLSPIYMENTIVLASLDGSKVRSIRNLSGKTLTLSENSYFNNVLESSSSLKDKPSIINRIPGGSGKSIEALTTGGCDAIITDSYALYYYR